MSDLQVRGAVVRFGDTVALAGADLRVAAGEVVTVLGPSGSGKSTLLRVVAGLTPLEAGSVLLGGRDLAGVPTYRRGVGLMFSDHALFPHLDVAGNVAFGLRMARWQAARRERRVAEMLRLVGLADRAGSRVQEMSGGQQQRVALARTLAPEPAVVLLDEPMSALDRALRRELADLLAEVLASTGATAVMVTHDRDEAFALGHRVAVMRDGAIVQLGTAEDLRERPADDWVRSFLADRA